MLREIKRLSGFDEHESAILLASFAVSQAEPGVSRALAKASFGNALKADRQFKRAIQMYEEALHEVSRNSMASNNRGLVLDSAQEADLLIVFDDDHNLHSGGREEDSSKRRRQFNEVSLLTSSIRFRIAICLNQLQLGDEAVAVLEQTKPVEDLPGPALALLAKLKHRKHIHDRGLPLYKLAVGKNGWLLQSMLALVDMEVPVEEIFQLCPALPVWAKQLVRAHALAAVSRTLDALGEFQSLHASHKNNSHVLTNLAKLELQRGNRDRALELFQRSQQVDGLNLDAVDIYASLLRGFGDSKRLVQLTHQLLSLGGDHHRPEPWIASALLAEMGDDREKALRYSSKALECDSLHLPALHFRSALLLSLNRPLESLSSCNKAFNLKRDFNGSKGLVDAYLALNRPLDAIAIAQEAIGLMPQDPRVYILMAKALFSPNSQDRLDLACASLSRALKLDQDNLTATMLLADVRVAQYKLGACTADHLIVTAKLMKRALNLKPGINNNNRDVLHCKIGNLYLLVDDHLSALEHFTDALSWNAQCADALDALETLDMRNHHQQQQRRGGNNQQATPMTSLKRSPPPAFRLMMSARGRESM
ncbi:hypothetical protein BASA81_015303 [Batrachochytrium salamandrivorans]|nr:hypothetical protein BASA81_015303 [Batrachochytrium salamandrivorans]